MAIQPIKTAALLEINGEQIEHPEVTLLPIDQVMFEKTGRARGWTVEANQLTFLFFCTWHALKRRGEYAGTYDEFMNQALVVREHQEDETDEHEFEEAPAGEADPTQPGA